MEIFALVSLSNLNQLYCKWQHLTRNLFRSLIRPVVASVGTTKAVSFGTDIKQFRIGRLSIFGRREKSPNINSPTLQKS